MVSCSSKGDSTSTRPIVRLPSTSRSSGFTSSGMLCSSRCKTRKRTPQIASRPPTTWASSRTRSRRATTSSTEMRAACGARAAAASASTRQRPCSASRARESPRSPRTPSARTSTTSPARTTMRAGNGPRSRVTIALFRSRASEARCVRRASVVEPSVPGAARTMRSCIAPGSAGCPRDPARSSGRSPTRTHVVWCAAT